MTNCSLDCASISRASATCHLTKFSHRNCKQAMVNKTIVTDNANVWGNPCFWMFWHYGVKIFFTFQFRFNKQGKLLKETSVKVQVLLLAFVI